MQRREFQDSHRAEVCAHPDRKTRKLLERVQDEGQARQPPHGGQGPALDGQGRGLGSGHGSPTDEGVDHRYIL